MVTVSLMETTTPDHKKSGLVAAVLDSEWEMFQQVKSAYPVSCQQSPQTFRQVRGSIFEQWTEEMLVSYLGDLRKAKQEGRNLLTEKYARMDNRLPRTNFHPLIDAVVAIETDWQLEIKEKYPYLYSRVCRGSDATDDGRNFSVYLRCELETYGERTIELYHQQVRNYRRQDVNLSLKMLERLAIKSGFKDLDHAEAHCAGHQ